MTNPSLEELSAILKNRKFIGYESMSKDNKIEKKSLFKSEKKIKKSLYKPSKKRLFKLKIKEIIKILHDSKIKRDKMTEEIKIFFMNQNKKTIINQ